MTLRASRFGLLLVALAPLAPLPALAADLAFVTSQNAEMVTVVDLEAGKILAQSPVAGAPAPVAYEPARQRAYVISAKSGQLTVMNEAGGLLVTRELGEGAFGIATAPDHAIFVSDWYNHRLTRLDPDLNPEWTAQTGAAPAGVALSPDGAFVVSADRDDDQISIFDAATGQLRHRTKVGRHPYAVAIFNARIWTTDVQSDTVTVVDPVSGNVSGVLKTGSHPYGIAFAGGKGFVTNQYAGTVTVFDPENLAILATLETGDYPEGIAALPDDSGVVVVHWESNTMLCIDARTLKPRWEITLPDGPRAFGLFTGRQG